jgi:hypothetical protein
MPLTLTCPQCEGTTELRGTLGSWYLTWCPECGQLWRLDWRTLLEPAARSGAADTSRIPPSTAK